MKSTLIRAMVSFGAIAALPGLVYADHNSLHPTPCNESATVGGGAFGNSPGPVSPLSAVLGWDVGAGQCNGSFTVTRDISFPADGADGIELGMRAEQRRVGQVARNLLGNGVGDYEVQTGPDTTFGPALNRAWWNFQPSLAYDGEIDALDGVALAIRTDVGPNQPSAPVFDLLELRDLIDARNNQPNPTISYDEIYQTSQNPEFGYFVAPNDDDANPDGGFDYDEEGAWLMTLAAAEQGEIAQVSICIHTPNAACAVNRPTVYTCTGFGPPADESVSIKKPGRVVPLKMACTGNNGATVGSGDIAAPRVQVTKVSGGMTGPLSGVSGRGRADGDQFVFRGNRWQFNLSTRDFPGSGTYEVNAISAGSEVLVGSPSTTIEIE